MKLHELGIEKNKAKRWGRVGDAKKYDLRPHYRKNFVMTEEIQPLLKS